MKGQDTMTTADRIKAEDRARAFHDKFAAMTTLELCDHYVTLGRQLTDDLDAASLDGILEARWYALGALANRDDAAYWRWMKQLEQDGIISATGEATPHAFYGVA